MRVQDYFDAAPSWETDLECIDCGSTTDVRCYLSGLPRCPNCEDRREEAAYERATDLWLDHDGPIAESH